MNDNKDNNKTIELGESSKQEIKPPLNLIESQEDIKEIKTTDSNILPTLNTQLGEDNQPKLSLLSDKLQVDENDELYSGIKMSDTFIIKQSTLVPRYLYISKDFIFLFILLISSGLNFNYLYLPYLLIVFISYFLLFKSGKNSKIFKRVLEIFTLVYSVGLLVFKLYFSISVKTGKDFDDYNQLLLDFGVLSLLDKDSNYFLVASFIGESLVILFSIYSLVISFLNKDNEVGEFIDPKNEIQLNDFYSLMTRCIYLFYISIVGWSIFNRSILTLIYIVPLNVILYILAMNYKKKLLFYIFKFFSITLSIIIFIHIILINVFNVATIRDYYITNDLEIRDNYPRVITAWTKLGINQAFHKDMPGHKIAGEYTGYIFASLSLLVLAYTNKKLTFNKSKKVLGKIRTI